MGRLSSSWSVSTAFVGDCVGISFPVDARSWIFSYLTVVVHKLPSHEIGGNKGVGPLGSCCCCVSSSYFSFDTNIFCKADMLYVLHMLLLFIDRYEDPVGVR